MRGEEDVPAVPASESRVAAQRAGRSASGNAELRRRPVGMVVSLQREIRYSQNSRTKPERQYCRMHFAKPG